MDLSHSAILMLDFQNDFVHPEGRARVQGTLSGDAGSVRELVATAVRLVDAGRAAGAPIVWVSTVLRSDGLDNAMSDLLLESLALSDGQFLVEGSWGAQPIDALTPAEGDFTIVKTGHSAFQATTLDRVLANLGVDTCVCAVGGFLDDLVQTIAEGSALRYEMVVPVDAVDASRREHQRMWRHRSTVTTSAEAIEELAASAASRRPKAPGGAALLVIDLQNDFLHPEGVRGRLGYSLLTEEERGSIIEKNQALCQAARAAGRPVIFARVGARKDNLDRAWAQAIRRELPIADDENYLLEGSWGAEVVEGVDVDDNDFQVTKKGNSAFGFTPLHRILRNLNVTTCIVSGGAVHGCIEATVREGVGLGYSFVVVPDAAYPPGTLIPEVLGTQAEFMNTEEAIARLRPVQ